MVDAAAAEMAAKKAAGACQSIVGLHIRRGKALPLPCGFYCLRA